jgi:hypothetical protein
MLAVRSSVHCGARFSRLIFDPPSLCLEKLGIIKPEDYAAVVNRVFWKSVVHVSPTSSVLTITGIFR